MICIFSNELDASTTDVIKWLYYLGRKDVIRINYNERDRTDGIRIHVTQNDFYFYADEQLIPLKAIDAVWYRKGKNWMCDPLYTVSVTDHSKFTGYLNNKLRTEENRLSEYLNYIIENKVPILGSSTKSDLNKLIVLSMAAEVGLLVPEFYISNGKKELMEIVERSQGLITKSISDGLYLFEKTETNTGYFTYTEQIDKEKIRQLPEQIHPSLLQQNIIKKYELRIFFIENTCYSMAIFSQNDEQTKIDFRKYNEEKPNRYVPYQLPDEIEEKIKHLFNKLGLNTGSVDLLVDQKNNFYFLEINPVGQFAMVSQPCNYFLEKKIALSLMKHERKN